MPRRTVLSALAAIAVVAGIVALVGVVVVRTVVLHPGTYTTALARTDATERVYTEVLADPELADVKEALLGDLGVPPALAVQARALGVNVLRWTVPPSTLRRWSDAVIAGALAYVRGDTPGVRVDVVVADVVGRVPDAAVREARALMASAVDHTVESLGELRSALGAMAAELARGEVPAAIPKVGGATFDPQQLASLILEALGTGADPVLHQAVVATLIAGDQRDAIVDAAGAGVAEHATVAADRLRAEPTVDVAALVAARAGRPVHAVVATLDGARSAARWLGPWTAVAGAIAAAAGIVALAWLHRGRRRPAAWWIGGALVAAGVVVAVGWLVARRAIGSPLDPMSTPHPDGWGFPPALAALIHDVADEIDGRLGAVVWRAVGLCALAGVAVLAGAALTDRVRIPGNRRLALLGAGAGAVLVAVAVAGSEPRDAEGCEGHVELCARRYDDVTFAATHNSMSAPDVVPVWPEHDGGITAQLDAGVRALLVDTHHWPPLTSAAQLSAAVSGDEAPMPPAIAAALHRLAEPAAAGRPGSFLCHIHCAFGAQPLVDGLTEVRDFLAANPTDVVTLIIQDAISPAETAAAFDAAGLTRFVHTQQPAAPWPTLGEMIDGGERLVVFAEEEGPPPAWYANAFRAMQETPFLFLSPEQFSCAPNRGDLHAALFLMNHWIQRIAPDRADAVRVNRLDVLVDRARQCERERGLRPNYLAVNFYDIGDLVRAADVLNGVAR